MSHFVYIVRCADGTLYTGYTTNVEKRVATHNKGKGAKYTRTRLPVELVYSAERPSKSKAMSLEYSIKQLTRAEKEDMIECYVTDRVNNACIQKYGKTLCEIIAEEDDSRS